MAAPNIVAVVCVVDSSLALLAEWHRVFSEYITPLLQRLHEIHANHQFLIGFVCYATACTRPTPLLSKSFFTPPQNVLKEVREDPSKYGIGQTGSGGSRGMAVLEGVVAAVEMFDMLKESVQDPVCHIIHVTACSPDTADRPLWNTSPRLDFLTWDNLPAELRKRDISYSNILLQRNPRLSQFQQVAAGGSAQAPWFPTRPQHSLHLSGYPSQKGTKRVGEPASSADRNPDTKRARVASGSSQTSPKATPKVSPALPPTPASTTTATPSTQASPSVSVTGNVASSSSTTQPQATPASAPIPSIPNQKSFAMLMDRYKAMELSMRHKVNVMEAHKAAGRLKESAALKAEIQDLMPKLNRFKAVLIQAQAQQAGQMKQPPQANQQPQPSPQISQPQPAQQPAQVAEGSQSQVPLAQPTSTVPTVEATTTATSVQSTTTPLQQPQQVTAPTQIQALPAQVESAQGGGVGLHVPPNTSPQMAAAHMQKLIEQRNRTPVLSKASIPGPQQPGAEHGQSVGNVAGVGGVTPQAPTGTGHQALVWKGTLSWRGSDSETQARKELRAQVIVQAQIDQIAFDSWPPVLSLMPSREPALPLLVLQEWIRKHRIVPFQINCNSQCPDTKTNESNYNVLGKLLSEKNIYALAAWGNEKPENRVLLFWLSNNNKGIVGLYFPLQGGMPELPRNVICGFNLNQVPPPIAVLLSKLPPEQQNQLNQLPQEKRIAALQGLLTRQMVLRNQQMGQQQGQAGSQGSGMAAHGPGDVAAGQMVVPPGMVPGVPGVPGVMGGHPGQMPNPGMGLPAGIGQPHGGIHQRSGSGSGGVGGLGNVSLDVLQSFMQRKPDGPNVGHD